MSSTSSRTHSSPTARLSRNRRSGESRTARQLQRRREVFESLETRTMMSATLAGQWTAEGPGPIYGTYAVTALLPNPSSGAVETIALDPTNPNRMFVGTTNGGVWRTDNGQTPIPHWTPLTDFQQSLSIGSLAFDPLDATENTLYAGIADISNGGGVGGPAIGILKTTDGGNTWVVSNGLSGQQVLKVFPTGQMSPFGEIIFAATTNGLFQSTDGGVNYSAAFTPTGFNTVSDIIADPSDPTVIYIAVPGNGVFKGDANSVNWTNITAGITGVPGSSNMKLAAQKFGAGSIIYTAVVDTQPTGGALSGVFWSANQGGSWVTMDLPGTTEENGFQGIHPGLQGNNTSFVADPNNPFVVYIAGDGQPSADGAGEWSNSIGADHETGRVFRGNAILAPGTQWTPATNDFANTTAPHPDSRALVFDSLGNLDEADDGGIYRLYSPGSNAQLWESVIGDMAPTEFYSTSYDSVNHVIFGGAQDNGSSMQISPGSTAWVAVNGGDGITTAVSNFNGQSTHYTSAQTLGNFRRTTYDNQGNVVSDDAIELDVNGSSQNLINGDSTIPFVAPYAINAIDPTRMLIGTEFLYESFNQGDDLNLLNNGPTPQTITDTVSAIAYGGIHNGLINPEVAYVGNSGGLWIRTSIGGAFNQSNAYSTAGGLRPVKITLDPADWMHAFVVDGQHVFQTTDAGTTWTDITGTLPAGQRPVSVAFVPSTGSVVIGTTTGVFVTNNAGAGATWTPLGDNLPTVRVNSLQYDPTDDVLVAGTMGRGAWLVSNAATQISNAGILTINGDPNMPGQVDNILLKADFANPTMLDVYENNSNTPIAVVPIANITKINVNGLGGNDVIYVDVSNGNFIPAGGVNVDGGSGSDLLTVIGADASNTYTLTAGKLVIGSGPSASTITYSNTEYFVVDGGAKADKFYVESTSPGVNTAVNGGAGDDSITVTSTPFDPSLKGTVDNIVSPLLIDGGGGADDLVFNDNADITADHLTVTPTSVGAGSGDNFFGNGGSATYTGVEHLQINMGTSVRAPTQGNYLQVTGTARNTPTYINTGNADDSILISSIAAERMGLTNQVVSPLVIDGQKGTNTMRIDDTADTTSRRVTLSDVAPGSQVGADPNDNFFGVGGSLLYFNLQGVNLWMGSGGNFIDVPGTHTGTPTTIRTGTGNDAVFVDHNGNIPTITPSGVGGVKSLLTIDGQSGQNSVSLNDNDSTVGKTVDITATTVGANPADNYFGAGGSLTYASLANLTVNLSGGNDTAYVFATAANTATNVNGLAGNDTFHVGTAGPFFNGIVKGVVSPLSFDGGLGSNSLSLNDGGDNLTTLVDITANQVGAAAGDTYFGAGGFVNYVGIGNLTVNGSNNNDQMILRSTSADTTLNGQGANDQIFVGSTGNLDTSTEDGIRNIVTVVGGNGTNTLLVGDGGDIKARTVTIGASKIGSASTDNYFAPGGLVTYQQIAGLIVQGGSGGNTIYVTDTAKGTSTYVFAGKGDDTVKVGSNSGGPGGTVKGVQSLLAINGQQGKNILTLEDSSDVLATTVTVTPSAATNGTIGKGVGDTFFSPAGSVQYGSFAKIIIDTGKGADTINIAPSPTQAGTFFSINEGSPVGVLTDILNLSMTGVGGPVLTDNGDGSGGLFSSDHAYVAWKGIKKVNQVP